MRCGETGCYAQPIPGTSRCFIHSPEYPKDLLQVMTDTSADLNLTPNEEAVVVQREAEQEIAAIMHRKALGKRTRHERFKYVADRCVTICLDGLRYARCSDTNYATQSEPIDMRYSLVVGHKGHDLVIDYGSDGMARDRMYSQLVEALHERHGLAFTTPISAHGRTSE